MATPTYPSAFQADWTATAAKFDVLDKDTQSLLIKVVNETCQKISVPEGPGAVRLSLIKASSRPIPMLCYAPSNRILTDDSLP